MAEYASEADIDRAPEYAPIRSRVRSDQRPEDVEMTVEPANEERRADLARPATEERFVRGACPHDCPDTCAWTVRVVDGRAVELRADKDHPYTAGGLCVKVNHFLEDRVYHPDRILHPLRRVGPKGEARFERIGWDEAIDEIAGRLRSIVDEHGAESVLPYSFLGTQGLVQGYAFDRRFFSRLGASRLLRTVCGNAGASGIEATLGSSQGILPEDIELSRLIVLWGTNTITTNLHLWPYIRRAREAGATVVVIDPLKTRTAEAADWHIRPLPGTDAALALGLMHVIVAEDLWDHDYVEHYTFGFEQLRERLAEYPPERVAQITGVPADEIHRLARGLATTRPSTIRLLVGMEHHSHGSMAFRTIACIPALTGAWREPGGGLLYMTDLFVDSLNFDAVTRPVPDAVPTRAINLGQIGRALTDASLDPPIKALIVYNSNPATIAPNQRLVLEGLRREDLFTVVLEHFMTDTASHADIVLPATTQAEHLDLNWSWGQAFLTLNQPAIEPLGEALPNSEIFRRLGRALGLDEAAFSETDEDVVRGALQSDHPYLAGISYEGLKERGWARFAIPAGWLPYAEGGFATPSGRCEFYSQTLADGGMDPLPTWEPAAESPWGDAELAARFPLILLSAKSATHHLNSSYGHLEKARAADGPPRLDISPLDAAARGIADGEVVEAFNDRATVAYLARVADRVPTGVVSAPSGWWASHSPSGLSVNALTQDGLSDMGQGPAFHDTLVEVRRAVP
jgi:anaerobic selenocysteine-containing dehydrogenase